MDQRVSIITLGVADLGRARSFYEALGWDGQEVEETVFFQTGGQAVVLWARAKVAADAGLDDDGTSTFGGIVLAHNVASRDEVDRIVGAAAAAGATVLFSSTDLDEVVTWADRVVVMTGGEVVTPPAGADRSMIGALMVRRGGGA
jgi:predicted lactoylglutathione lyase